MHHLIGYASLGIEHVGRNVIVVDAATWTPLDVPLFPSPDAAEGFLQYLADAGWIDPFALSRSTLRSMHDRWLANGSQPYRCDYEAQGAEGAPESAC